MEELREAMMVKNGERFSVLNEVEQEGAEMVGHFQGWLQSNI